MLAASPKAWQRLGPLQRLVAKAYSPSVCYTTRAERPPHPIEESLKMKFLPLVALAYCTLACTSTDRVDWVDYGTDPMQNPQYMADMTAAGTPGEQHEVLARRAGKWKVVGQVWVEPGMDPVPMNAAATVEVLLGGRYLVEEFKSDFMGMPFEGRLIQGYDNLRELYWSMWTDNMSTGYWMSHGVQAGPGELKFEGTATDILSPNGRPTRMTRTDLEDGSYTMKMFDTRAGGREFQSMELHYTRL